MLHADYAAMPMTVSAMIFSLTEIKDVLFQKKKKVRLDWLSINDSMWFIFRFLFYLTN